MFLPYVARLIDKKISLLSLADLSASNIIAFLGYLEEERGNSIATRNARLAALRAFLNYAATEVPDELPGITKALAVPQKRKNRSLVECLDRTEIDALLASPDKTTWSGRRDSVLLMTMYNTGARVSEIINVNKRDLDLQRQHTIHLYGKGRKERIIPLWPETVAALKEWINSNSLTEAVFTNRFADRLTRSGVRQRLACACRKAIKNCPSLASRHLSPHSIRHTTALHLLQAGVDLSVIALWLGHEQIETTHQYMEASLTMKKSALESLEPIDVKSAKRYQPTEKILAFLEAL